MDINRSDRIHFTGTPSNFLLPLYSWKDIKPTWPDLVKSLSTTTFHGDLMVEIMVRLPLKSLIRFLCVSKTWYFTVKDKTFCVKHLNYNKKINLLSECMNVPRITTPPFPFNPSPSGSPVARFAVLLKEKLPEQNVTRRPIPCQVIGIINGLACLVQSNNHVGFWNPATKEAYPLPAPRVFSPSDEHTTFGFGLHVGTENDYKVVRVTFRSFTNRYVEVYSHLRNSWTVCSQSNPVPWYLFGFKASVILDGIPYWRADEVTKGVDCFHDLVVRFDTCSDSFRAIEIPKLEPDVQYTWMLGTLGQSLAILLQRSHELEILSLDDKGWSKAFSIITTIKNVDKWVRRVSNGKPSVNVSRKFSIHRTCFREITYLYHDGLVILNEAFEYSESLVSPQSPHSQPQWRCESFKRGLDTEDPDIDSYIIDDYTDY